MFVPPCHKAHAVCSKCLFKCLCKTGDIRDFYSCVMCRAQICIRAALPTLWFACILASGADEPKPSEYERSTGNVLTFFPAISRANMFRDVRSGALRVRAASRLLGSPPNDDHECSQCAIPNCFQCAASAWPESPLERRGEEATTSDSPVQLTGDITGAGIVAALIHLTPGIEQRSLVLYAKRFAQLTPDRLLSLSASDVADFPLEHQRRLLEHTANIARLLVS